MYLLFGWLWFLGTLVPVIGIVHIGRQSIADRYTYLPSIGISVAIAFAICNLTSVKKGFRAISIVAVFGIVCSLLLMTWVQCGYWRNSCSIFSHAVDVTKNNYSMQMNYGFALQRRGEFQESFAAYQTAIAMSPSSGEPFLKCGLLQLEQERYQQAIVLFKTAIHKKEDVVVSELYNNLGISYSKLKDYSTAISYFKKAIQEDPDEAEVFKNLSLTLLKDQEKQAALKTAQKGLSLAVSANNSDLKNWFETFIQNLQSDSLIVE